MHLKFLAKSLSLSLFDYGCVHSDFSPPSLLLESKLSFLILHFIDLIASYLLKD